MRRQLFALATIALLGFAAAPGLALESSNDGAVEANRRATEVASREFCKICRKGKACGDSCISRDKKCNKPPGCACDA